MRRHRSIAVFKFFLVVFALLLIRIGYIQFHMGGKLLKAASIQRMIQSEVEKPRGEIIDRNMIPFTNRAKKASIVLMPLVLRNNRDGLEKTARILGLDSEELIREVNIKREPIILETTETRKSKILALKVNGISSVNSLKRYDKYSLAKHILGYLSLQDEVGKAGIEKFYEDALVIDDESLVGVITDARENPVEGLGYRMFSAEKEDKELDIKVTLDYRIQKIVEEVMERNKTKGAVVVEDVLTGDIAAMASKPDYDPTRIGDYLNSPGKELFNRAVASYNLGSIFKIIVMAAALEKEIKFKEDFYCPGYIKIGNKVFGCDKSTGHGYIDCEEAFAWSCNPYFIDLGISLGHEAILEMAQRFGLGVQTGIAEQGVDEAAGNLPGRKNYFTYGDIANISIGQGAIMATPLQAADIVATVANGGIRNRINIVDSVVDADGNKVREVRVKQGHRVISRSIADKIRELMEGVTSDTGTGYNANLDLYGGAGGKTGSAETGQLADGERVTHAWFVGYFPQKNPRYSLSVFVENGKRGGAAAAPIFAQIAEEILKKKY